MSSLVSKIIPELVMLSIILGFFGFDKNILGVALTNYVVFSVWIYLVMVIVRIQGKVSPIGLIIVLSLPFLLFYGLWTAESIVDFSNYSIQVLLVVLVAQLASNTWNILSTYQSEQTDNYMIIEKYAAISLFTLLPGLLLLPEIFKLFDIAKDLSFVFLFIILIMIDIVCWVRLYRLNKIR